MTPFINAADAFVAAWLPGTEGGGVADVLLRDGRGGIQHDFRGRLSFSWPKNTGQTSLNRGDASYDPLFAYGYGLDYASRDNMASLAEPAASLCVSEIGAEHNKAGRAVAPWKMALSSGGRSTVVEGPRAASADGRIAIRSVDRTAQEDAREITGNGPAAFA